MLLSTKLAKSQCFELLNLFDDVGLGFFDRSEVELLNQIQSQYSPAMIGGDTSPIHQICRTLSLEAVRKSSIVLSKGLSLTHSGQAIGCPLCKSRSERRIASGTLKLEPMLTIELVCWGIFLGEEERPR